MLWGLSYRLTGCAADADDIVQETFVRAAERRCPPGDPSWRSWLVRVAYGLDGFDDPATQTTAGLLAIPFREAKASAGTAVAVGARPLS